MNARYLANRSLTNKEHSERYCAKRKPIHFGLPVLLALICLSLVSLLGGVPRVYAAVNLSSWCTGSGLSWDSSTSTCTVTADVGSIPGGTENPNLEISSGETLLIAGPSASSVLTSCSDFCIYVPNGLTLIVDSGGSITINISEEEGIGITSAGTITNSGTITIENSGTGSYGIDNSVGTITNSGTITIENSAGTGIFEGPEATITDTCTGTIALIPPGTISGFTLPVPVTGTCGTTTTTTTSTTSSSTTSRSSSTRTLVCPSTAGGSLMPPGATFVDSYGNTWVAPSGNDGGGYWNSYFFAGPSSSVPPPMQMGWGGDYGTYSGQQGWVVTFYC